MPLKLFAPDRNTLIRLSIFPGWPESSLVVNCFNVILKILSVITKYISSMPCYSKCLDFK